MAGRLIRQGSTISSVPLVSQPGAGVAAVPVENPYCSCRLKHVFRPQGLAGGERGDRRGVAAGQGRGRGGEDDEPGARARRQRGLQSDIIMALITSALNNMDCNPTLLWP